MDSSQAPGIGSHGQGETGRMRRPLSRHIGSVTAWMLMLTDGAPTTFLILTHEGQKILLCAKKQPLSLQCREILPDAVYHIFFSTG